MRGASRKAETPFDDPKADIIIRSSDNVDFHVFKWPLAYSSTVFEDMFHVAGGIPGAEEMKDGIPLISTEESANTWNILLRLAYPTWGADLPGPISLDEVSAALESSRKYGMEMVGRRLCTKLTSFAEPEPIRVFAKACHYGLDAVARVAAKQTLRQPLYGNPYISELETITAGVYHRLEEYHQQCGKVASDIARDMNLWLEPEDPFVWYERHSCDTVIEYRGSTWVTVSKWWSDYMKAAAKELKVRPCGATVVDSKLMDAALIEATSCKTCRPRAFADMKVFGERFAAKIEKVTSKVSHVPFFAIPPS
jgi:hypothetical protein